MTVLSVLSKEFPNLRLVEAEPLARHTSFRIGGPASMAFPEDLEQLAALYIFCRKIGIPLYVLGAGTNILAPDGGLDRLVICTRNMTEISDLHHGMLKAQCGVSMARLALYARDAGLSGLEFAHGIPGTVGGGIYMNAGAYGGELGQIAVSTTVLLPDGTRRMFCGREQEFSYRSSVFQRIDCLVLETCFRLEKKSSEEISKKMEELAARRRGMQPLDKPSAGSTFKRPEGGYAAALIDQAGLKGRGVGRAAVSEKHAGFVINLGGATAADVLATMELIQMRVYENSGIRLEPEIRIW